MCATRNQKKKMRPVTSAHLSNASHLSLIEQSTVHLLVVSFATSYCTASHSNFFLAEKIWPYELASYVCLNNDYHAIYTPYVQCNIYTIPIHSLGRWGGKLGRDGVCVCVCVLLVNKGISL